MLKQFERSQLGQTLLLAGKLNLIGYPQLVLKHLWVLVFRCARACANVADGSQGSVRRRIR